jgi:hypothetical protein
MVKQPPSHHNHKTMNPAQLIIAVTVLVIVVGLLCYFTTPPSVWKGRGAPTTLPVSASSPHTPHNRHSRAALALAAREVFANSRERLTYGALHARVRDARACTGGTASRLIDEMLNAGTVHRLPDGVFVRDLEC